MLYKYTYIKEIIKVMISAFSTKTIPNERERKKEIYGN